MRRLTTSVALAAALVAGGATGAQATPEYPPTTPPSLTPDMRLVIGGKITFNSGGFAPGSNVKFSVVNNKGETVISLELIADENGQIRYDFNVNFGGFVAAVASGQNADGQSVESSKVISVENPATGGANTGSGTDGTGSNGSAAGGSTAGDHSHANSGKPVTEAVLEAGSAKVVKTAPGATNGQLAKTGPEGMAPMVWAGAGLLAAGGGLVALTVVRRRSNQLS